MKMHSFRLLDTCEVNVWPDQTNTSRAVCHDKWACSMIVVTSTIFSSMCVALLYQGQQVYIR